MSLIIAEIGTSHEGNFEKACKLIDAACESNCDAVKFQWVYADEILHPETGYVQLPTGNIRLYDRFKQLECPVSFYRQLLDYVHSKGKLFCCSPFGLKSLEELISINPDIVKVASPELNYYQMLEAISEYKKKKDFPVILSSGVSTLSDIEKAVQILGTDNVSLLHCITSYPAPEEEYNLKVIRNLSNIFGINCGVSDHSLDPILVPALSVVCGGTIIEKHITLSRQTDGLDDPVALEPEQFAMMAHVVHQTETCLNHYGTELGVKKAIEQLEEGYGKERIEKIIGTGIKKLAPSENANYGRTNRSLHFMKNLNVGDVITKDDIGILRTEKVLTPGISPEFYDLVLGSTVKRNIKAGEGMNLSDFFEKK